MEAPQKSPSESYEARDFGWLVAMSMLFFALVAIGFWREYNTQWAPYQREFPGVLGHYGNGGEARKFTPGIKQIWIPQIAVTDRCVTCHLGYDWSAVLPPSLGQPLTPHPAADLISKHPFEKFGCTPCHGGQGWATNAQAAHVGGPGWIDPMISPALAVSDGLTMSQMMQMRCNFCHRHDEATPGMDEINRAKVLLRKRKCFLCHSIEGRGGNAGPELTYEGDSNPELYDFSHVTGPKTFFNWNVQHLMHASLISPATQMPDYNMPIEDARSLSLLLLSWRRQTFPPEYIPNPAEAAAAMQPVPSPPPAAPAPEHR